MERLSVLGFVLTVVCVITSEYASYGDTRFSVCSEDDLEALIDFKNGLEDPEDRLSSWQGSNCCQWRGVGCDHTTGAVIAIDLRNPYPVSFYASNRYGFGNLSGEIRPSLLKLKSLQYLDLSLNTFNDIPIPEFIGSLEKLHYLNLSSSGFSGAIPPNLGNLSRLQYLDLSTAQSLKADSLEWVTGLVSLKHLAMNHVNLVRVYSNWDVVLNQLSNLTELHLSHCRLTGPIQGTKPVNLTSLAVLDLSFNSLNSEFPDWLVYISTLVYVDLSHCGLYGRIPLGIGELPNLQYLSLAGNNKLTASCSQLFRRSWSKVQFLNLASNKLHGTLPSSIGNITSLTNFDLSFNNVEGQIPSSIGSLCNLRNLDLSGNNLTGSLPEFMEGTNNCVSNSPLPSLMYLRLSNNYIQGKLPEWLGQLENLVELILSYNLLQGPIPAALGNLQNLAIMSLEANELDGTLPESFGNLSELSTLEVTSNRLTGIISEVHFSRLSKLKFLHLSFNSFILNVSSNWIPPFQVKSLDMHSCNLGPLFPSWLKTQKAIMFLDFSNASISDSIPHWLCNISRFASLDFRITDLNQRHIPLAVFGVGSILQNIRESVPFLHYLSLSGNQLTGEIPASIGQMQHLQVIDLSKNNLTGSIPPSIGKFLILKALDLAYNHLSGKIPASFGHLSMLQSLHVNNNKLTGGIPSSFQNLEGLETMDLANNRLSGYIPSWIGDGYALAELRILKLQSNEFSGEIPAKLSNLKSLQVLNLAENNLTGNIPGTLGDLQAMACEQNTIEYLAFGKYKHHYYIEMLITNTKGRSQRLTKNCLVNSIDLSGNNLSGDFPKELTKLPGLVVLNLSGNHISGQIPENISSLYQLASLDLSSNNLSGAVPSSLSSLSSLTYLNLSDNNFLSTIPCTNHSITYDASAFSGNLNPLPVKCQSGDLNEERMMASYI